MIFFSLTSFFPSFWNGKVEKKQNLGTSNDSSSLGSFFFLDAHGGKLL